MDPRDDLRRLEPYLADFRVAAAEEGIALALLCGVCLRETWAGWAPGYSPKGTHLGFGDLGRAWGLYQANLAQWEPALRGLMVGVDLLTPLGQARLAAHHLATSYRLLQVVFPLLGEPLIRQASVAAYNASIGKVAGHLAAGRSVDEVTTEGPSGRRDYSADVLARADLLRRRAPDLFPTPAG